MKATIQLTDEANATIHGLSAATRRKLKKKFSYLMPHARHVPAYKLGRWDGMKEFFNFGGKTYVSLLPDILPILINEGYTVDLQDDRVGYDIKLSSIDEQHFSEKVWPSGHPIEGQPVILRDYQVEIINNFLTNPASCQEVATGAGKTLITAALSNLVETSLDNDDLAIHKLAHGSNLCRSLVIVPNKGLVTQTEEDFINLGLDVGVYYGDRKEYNRTHTICTWQSLEVIRKNHKAGNPMSLEDFAAGVTAVIIDEAHGAKGNVLAELLTGPFRNIPIRWGLTGTIPPEKHEAMSLNIAIGPVVGGLSASTLQDEGVLSNCDIDIIQLQDSVHYDSYQSELSYLTTDESRLDYMAEFILEVSTGGNTLVLVDRISAGKGLLKRLPEDRAVFISGDMKNDDRREHYAEISKEDNKIIVATYGVASTGINIPRIFNMVMVESGKSFIRVIQSIGRGLRKAKDKSHVYIYDICSSAKFSKRHLTERKKYYKKSAYPHKVHKVHWRNNQVSASGNIYNIIKQRGKDET